MAKINIDELQALVETATPGPWYSHPPEDDVINFHGVDCVGESGPESRQFICTTSTHAQSAPDAELIVAKNRNGATGTVYVRWMQETARFLNGSKRTP